VVASSVGFIFKACGLRVTSIKIDPCMLDCVSFLISFSGASCIHCNEHDESVF
jgi:hypothetical protein